MKQAIVMRRDLKMRRGKEIGQGAHASLGAYFDCLDRLGPIGPDYLSEWSEGGKTKIVFKVSSEEELLALAAEAEKENLGHYLVRDHGKTEVPPNTATAFAVGPDLESNIDRITSDLELY